MMFPENYNYLYIYIYAYLNKHFSCINYLLEEEEMKNLYHKLEK